MSKLTIEIPAELKAVLDRYPEVQWEQVAEKALWGFARKVRLADQLAARSKLDAKGAEAIGRSLKAGLRRRYMKAAR
jgi:hypothetical protein